MWDDVRAFSEEYKWNKRSLKSGCLLVVLHAFTIVEVPCTLLWGLSRLLPHNRPGLKEEYSSHTTWLTGGSKRGDVEVSALTCRINNNKIRGVFNKFPDFFLQAFKIVVDSWKFSMLLLYILWDDWSIRMISGSNQQLQQQLEYTLLKPDCHSWGISKMQSGREEKWYAIKLF